MGEIAARPSLTSEQIRACRRSIRAGSKSFYVASLVLPRDVRNAASALYSFCRLSDDVADDPRATLGSIKRLRDRLDAAYRGDPQAGHADMAFSRVIGRYDIPHAVPASMLEGFEWDVTGKQYETFGELLNYAARVAGTVGVMMTIVMRRRTARTLARACDLGVAMQLTNIARDVGEDACNGRLYLPQKWMREEGIDPQAFLADPVFTPALGRVVERLLTEADRIYARSLTGLADLPLGCRPGIRAAGLVYADIGAQIRCNGFDSVSRRAHTSRSRKLFLLGQALADSVTTGVCDESPAMRETSSLVQAAASAQIEARNAGEWFVDLVARLNQRDRSLVSGRPTRATRGSPV